MNLDLRDPAGQPVSFSSIPNPTVTYFDDSEFAPSLATATHQVNPAPTTTTAGAILPSPAPVGIGYEVPFTVTSAFGPPTGSVTVSDGEASNTFLVSASTCALASVTAGAKTITVCYLGDSDFAASTDTGALQVCSYAITPLSNALNAVGGNGAIVVTAPSGCPWAASQSLPWISIISRASGVGTGTIGYQVGPNSSVLGRSGDIVVANQTHTVAESGIPCSYSINRATNSLGDSRGKRGYLCDGAADLCLDGLGKPVLGHHRIGRERQLRRDGRLPSQPLRPGGRAPRGDHGGW